MYKTEAEIENGSIVFLEYYLLITQLVGETGSLIGESYGVEAICRREGVMETESFADITIDRRKIEELISLLSKNNVSPVTMSEILEDWLAE